jgi:hypothetical protein
VSASGARGQSSCVEVQLIEKGVGSLGQFFAPGPVRFPIWLGPAEASPRIGRNGLSSVFWCGEIHGAPRCPATRNTGVDV